LSNSSAKDHTEIGPPPCQRREHQRGLDPPWDRLPEVREQLAHGTVPLPIERVAAVAREPRRRLLGAQADVAAAPLVRPPISLRALIERTP
jgi:hypothetical protein